jgi:hypothetical protein
VASLIAGKGDRQLGSQGDRLDDDTKLGNAVVGIFLVILFRSILVPSLELF